MPFGRMGSLGRGFGRMGGGSGAGVGVDPDAPVSPTLDLISASDTGSSNSDNITSDTTPDIDITAGDGWPFEEDDEIKVYDNAVLAATHTVTAGEVGGDPISLGLSPLDEGAHSLAAEHIRDGHTRGAGTPLVITVWTSAPTITSADAFDWAENSAFSQQLTANRVGAWAITGGADETEFSITSGGLLTSDASNKNFEDPDDADTDGTYEVEVTFTDAAGNDSAPMTISVSLTDVDESGVPEVVVAPVISGNKQVGQTVSLSNGTYTNSPTGYAKQFTRNGSDISGATGDDYVLVEDDAGQDISGYVIPSNGSGAGDAAAASNSLTIDVYIVLVTSFTDTTDQTTYSGGSWNGVSIGVAAANRKVVLGLVGRSGNAACDWSSGSIGGNAAAIVTNGSTPANARNATSGLNFATLVSLDVPTGTTANLSNTFSQTVVRIGCAVFAVYGAGSVTDTDPSTATAPTATQTIAAGGAAIGVGMTGVATTATPTGLNAGDVDTQIESSITFTAGLLNSAAGGSTAMTFTFAVNPSNSAGAFASWAP